MKRSKKKASNNLKVIIIMGPPGSGKGTQAGLLAEKLKLFYFEPSKIGEARIREAKKGEYLQVEGKKYYFAHQEKLWRTGKLWDPPFIAQLAKDRIKKLQKEGQGLLLAGSPRTLYEGEKLIPFLKKLYGAENIQVILLEIAPKESIDRNSKRRICELVRHSILYTKETKNLKNCPLDGSRLLKRKGLDDPEVIKTRLKEYKERTFPLMELFKKEGLDIKKINGSLAPAKVFKSILKKIDGFD